MDKELDQKCSVCLDYFKDIECEDVCPKCQEELNEQLYWKG